MHIDATSEVQELQFLYLTEYSALLATYNLDPTIPIPATSARDDGCKKNQSGANFIHLKELLGDSTALWHCIGESHQASLPPRIVTNYPPRYSALLAIDPSFGL